jgi:predicted molibdopterin-dependent oxidoreductase YjgC
MRVIKHPVLEDLTDQKYVTILYGERPIEAIDGEPVAAALINAGIRVFRKTAKRHEPRGVFCAIGRCTDCMMIVDGVPNTRTCVTSVHDGMRVRLQDGLAPPGAAKDGKDK